MLNSLLTTVFGKVFGSEEKSRGQRLSSVLALNIEETMGKSQEVAQPTSKSSSSIRRLSVLKKVLGNDKSVPKSIAPGSVVSKKDEHGDKSKVLAMASSIGSVGATGTGSNMRKLLDDLHQSRIGIEQDQKAYQKARLEIAEVDKKLSKLKLEAKNGEDKWNNLVKAVAEKKTELSTVEIRNKIVENSLKRGEQELANALEELHKVRLEPSELASSFLSDSINFAWQWNGTELGRRNRLQHDRVEMENLQREKSQLELELKDFLVLKKEVEECERAKVELEHEYNAHDERICGREKELQERIFELDAALLDLQKQKDELIRSSEEECQKLRLQTQESMKRDGSKLKDKKDHAIEGQVSHIDLCSDELKSNSESQGSNKYKFNAAGADTSNRKKIDTKHRHPNFQTPVVKSEPSNTVDINNSNYGGSFSNSNDEDIDICLAAAEAASQSLRIYEPMTPAPAFSNKRPPPAKVRAVERQTPITTFMKQQSTAKIFPRNSSARGNPNSSTSGKVFQFKKKARSFSEKENVSTDFDSLSASSSSTSVLDQCEPEPVCATKRKSEPSNQINYYTRYSGDDFYDKPYSSFNSRRILLSKSQEELL